MKAKYLLTRLCPVFPAICFAAAIALQTAAANAQPQPEVRHSEMRLDPSREATGRGSTSRSIEVPIEAAEPFLAVGVVWVGDEHLRISLRGSTDGRSWSDWREFPGDHDSTSRPGEHSVGLMLLDRRTRFVQYRIEGDGGAIAGLRLSFISPGATPGQMRERIQERAAETMNLMNQPPSTKYPKPPVVTRTEWGCPDGQITTHGTVSYTTVTHLIIHHTATGNEATDWAAVVRTIWNFHIFTNGWADIGYNYLIDPNGVIYEGRSGGDNVVGAHFSGVNSGTMGVAMLGTFTSIAPASRALNSLKKILAWKCDQRNLDPAGTSLHSASQLNLKIISGHRDGPGSTECPGNSLYPLLPSIRSDVSGLLSSAGVVAGVSAASFQVGALAPESIVALFGNSLAASTAAASSTALPVSLGGTSVTVRDNANNERLAPLFFVSEGQINFLMPQGLVSGPAVVIATSGDGRYSRGTINIAAVAPSLFSANANGRGVAAALALRVKADGSQSYEQVAVFDQSQNQFVAQPIDLGPESDQVFLVAFGTGIRFRNSLSGVTAKIGGLDSQVLYAGPASGFVGLDQVNIRLSRTLIGRGEIDLEISVDGNSANALKVKLR